MITVTTAATAREAAAKLGRGVRVMGGGTLLMRDINYRAAGLRGLVRISEDLTRIEATGARIRIGAGAVMRDVIEHRDLDFLAPVARVVGGPAIRNMASVGGNLFAAHPYGDFATALLALDATVHWADGQEEAIETMLARRDRADGVVVAVSLARPGRDAFRFRKVSRVKPKGVSVMSIALRMPGAGQGGRIAFGAMGPTPLRAKAAEAALDRATLDAAGIAPVLAAATDGLAPADDSLASAWYRREVAPVHLKRLLLGEPG